MAPLALLATSRCPSLGIPAVLDTADPFASFPLPIDNNVLTTVLNVLAAALPNATGAWVVFHPRMPGAAAPTAFMSHSRAAAAGHAL